MKSVFTKYLWLLSFLFTLSNSVLANQSIQDTTVLRLDPEDSMGGTCNETFDEITYIPIENSQRCIVGKISKLEVLDNYFIVFDRSMDQVLVLNKDGSLHAKCENIPGLHKNGNMINNFNFNIFGDFTVQSDKQQILIRTNLDKENLFIFNFDGLFKGKIPLTKKNNGTRFWGFSYLDSNTFVYSVSHSTFEQDSAQSVAKELYLTNDFSSNIKSEIPYDHNNIAKAGDVEVNMDGPFYHSSINNSCFFTRSYDYNIYKIDKKGISDVYKVMLPMAYSVPTDFLYNEKKYRSKRRDYLNVNRQIVYALSNIYSIGPKLFITINNHQNTNHKIFSYNLKTSATLSLLNISPDSLSSFLPFINKSNSIQGCDGQYIYSSFSSLELFESREATQDKKPNYPAVLKKYFATQNRKSNPVIVQMKPKVNM